MPGGEARFASKGGKARLKGGKAWYCTHHLEDPIELLHALWRVDALGVAGIRVPDEWGHKGHVPQSSGKTN